MRTLAPGLTSGLGRSSRRQARVARSLSDTFAGIRPIDVPLFVVAPFVGGLAATLLFRWMVPALASSAKDVVVAKEVVHDYSHVSK